ncbi:MAG TPA: M23 family metallopeptidase, partial [Acidimicrobiia bacterium]|nr:M23 family metallopeptidase [Acidimicrobiia bacterium]
HGGGMSTLYAHQSSIAVSVGEVVTRGEVIGYVGCTGSCTGPHLHFEVRLSGVPVDPLQYLG